MGVSHRPGFGLLGSVPRSLSTQPPFATQALTSVKTVGQLPKLTHWLGCHGYLMPISSFADFIIIDGNPRLHLGFV